MKYSKMCTNEVEARKAAKAFGAEQFDQYGFNDLSRPRTLMFSNAMPTRKVKQAICGIARIQSTKVNACTNTALAVEKTLT